MEKEMVFYLKANRNSSYVISNLKHWLEAVMFYEGSYAYILCDNVSLKEQIIAEIDLNYDRIEFLESERNCVEMNRILSDICAVERWVKVGQAHLKTHWHAQEHNYPFFWNIDADDTYICLDPIRVAEMFKRVEDYSLTNGIQMNGLDMWRSMSVKERWAKGDNWSLGVTFVDNRVDWKHILSIHSTKVQVAQNIYEGDKDANLDWYFTYLRNVKAARIETFYFENMRFMHFYDYFINYPHLSMFCHWQKGKIKYPIIEHCFGAHFRTEIEIADDVIRLDMDIEDDEGLLALIACSKETFSFYEDIRNKDLKVGRVMEKRNRYLLDKLGKKELVCWGAGASFYKNFDLIKKAYDLKYVCDNDSKKWGKVLNGDVKCISPNELQEMQDVYVLVLIESPAINYKIIRQLLDMGITSFEHFDNWIEIVEGIVSL